MQPKPEVYFTCTSDDRTQNDNCRLEESTSSVNKDWSGCLKWNSLTAQLQLRMDVSVQRWTIVILHINWLQT